MRIIFAGTPQFANIALNALLDADSSFNYQIVAVLTQPDKPANRGMKLVYSPVKDTAIRQEIPIYQPHSLKLEGQYAEEAQIMYRTLHALQPDVIVVAAYGLLLPQWILDLPTAGCINIHASLLPRWRGAAPIQRAIQAGDTYTGVGLMQMELGLDTGPIYIEESLHIHPYMTGGQLYDILAKMGGNLLVKHLNAIVDGHLKPVQQRIEGIIYAHKLTKQQGLLNWNLPANVLVNQIRAFDPVPGSYFIRKNIHGDVFTYKVWAAHIIDAITIDNTVINSCSLTQSAHEVGDILSVSKDGLDIMCAPEVNQIHFSILRITEIQKPNGKRLSIQVCWQHLGFI